MVTAAMRSSVPSGHSQRRWAASRHRATTSPCSSAALTSGERREMGKSAMSCLVSSSMPPWYPEAAAIRGGIDYARRAEGAKGENWRGLHETNPRRQAVEEDRQASEAQAAGLHELRASGIKTCALGESSQLAAGDHENLDRQPRCLREPRAPALDRAHRDGWSPWCSRHCQRLSLHDVPWTPETARQEAREHPPRANHRPSTQLPGRRSTEGSTRRGRPTSLSAFTTLRVGAPPPRAPPPRTRLRRTLNQPPSPPQPPPPPPIPPR